MTYRYRESLKEGYYKINKGILLLNLFEKIKIKFEEQVEKGNKF